MSKMTKEQAAKILGVSINASEKEINAASRKLIAKYHPDAHRNDSAENQAKSEKNFKLVTMAKKTLLSPSTPNTQIPTSGHNTTQANKDRLKQKQKQTSQNSYNQYTNQNTPQNKTYHNQSQQYNKSKNFNNSSIPQVIDDAERQLDQIYASQARSNFNAKGDVIRITPSILVSLLFIAISIYGWFLAGMKLPLFANVAVKDFIWIILMFVFVIKIIIYDNLISYYVHNTNLFKHRNWLCQIGLESILTSLIVVATTFITTNTFLGIYILPIIFGILITIIGMAKSKTLT